MANEPTQDAQALIKQGDDAYDRKDYPEAFRCYRMAAEQGNAAAQCSMGVCYYSGQGVTQDYAKAVYWYTKAAGQGNTKAQYKLGCCYDTGDGVPVDKEKAVYWYAKAADQGHQQAQAALASLRPAKTKTKGLSLIEMVLIIAAVVAVFASIPFTIDLFVPDIARAKPLVDSQNTACLYVQDGLELKSLDDQNVKVKGFRFMAKAVAINVPTGNRTLVFDFKDDQGSAKSITVTANFETGAYYYVNYQRYKENNQKMVQVYLRPTEEGVYRDPEVKQHWYDQFFYWALKILSIM